MLPKKRIQITVAGLAIAGIVAAACTAQQAATPTNPAGPVPPKVVQQTDLPKGPSVPQASSQPITGFAPPSAGPNLLAKDWGERLGITVSDLKPATGQPLLNPKAGDLYFFSNASTTWGATNTKNAVWVIDAKTKKTVLEVAPAGSEGASSHGIAVSGDGKFIYLPQLSADNRIDVLDGRTFEVVQQIRTLGRPHHQKLWHDPKTGKDLIIGEDFGWNMVGSGFYVIDPSQKNAVVGGMSRGDFSGNPYVSAPSPDGKFIVVTVPAPTPNLRDKMDGYVAKIDPQNWRVIGMTPMKDPIYPMVSVDGKFAYVTSGGDSKIYKINMESMKEEAEVLTGPGPWGLALGYDGTKMYSADKGEGPGYNQHGRTTTIIDSQVMGVTEVEMIGETTDHAILSPDGKEIWFTSNAEHNIYVMDVATRKMTIIQDPADGDIHGGVFVQYKDDGKGGVIGEVVADYGGLHGSALEAQIKYINEPSLSIAIDRNGFIAKTVSVDQGKGVRLTIKNVGGTSTGKMVFESKDMGIAPVALAPGESKEIRWNAPAQVGVLKATLNSGTNKELTVTVKAPAPAAAAPGAGGPREILIHGKNMLWDVTSAAVKPGETVKFVVSNADDEPHNLVGVGDVKFLTPIVAPGQKVAYEWTAPTDPTTFKAICAFHPAMVVDVKVAN